jgi:hypothetical protein
MSRNPATAAIFGQLLIQNVALYELGICLFNLVVVAFRLKKIGSLYWVCCVSLLIWVPCNLAIDNIGWYTGAWLLDYFVLSPFLPGPDGKVPYAANVQYAFFGGYFLAMAGHCTIYGLSVSRLFAIVGRGW